MKKSLIGFEDATWREYIPGKDEYIVLFTQSGDEIIRNDFFVEDGALKDDTEIYEEAFKATNEFGVSSEKTIVYGYVSFLFDDADIVEMTSEEKFQLGLCQTFANLEDYEVWSDFSHFVRVDLDQEYFEAVDLTRTLSSLLSRHAA